MVGDENHVEETEEAAPQPSKTDAIVNEWFTQSFRDSPVSRDTDVYNCVQKALADLKARLNNEEN